jgi:hypothetical protein
VWIIDQEAGISVFDQTFANIPEKIDSDLIGGFFTALLGFSQEIANSQIQYLQLIPFRFYFHMMDRFVIVLACANHIDPESATLLANRIQHRFEIKYKNILSKNFNGNVSLFNSFATELEDEFQLSCLCHSEFLNKEDVVKKYYKKSKLTWQKMKDQILQHTQNMKCIDHQGLCCQVISNKFTNKK